MAKVTAWLVTLIGVLLTLPLIGVGQLEAMGLNKWLIPLSVLVIGITKLIRNYK